MALRSKTLTKLNDPVLAKPNAPEEPPEEVISQRRRPEGRFLLQVDRQTKVSFSTFEEAEKAGLAIKKNFPVVRVAVYDSVASENTILELPKD
jgi:hypothetical protein